jgi:tripartite-type tricarboxylate transporter receptor subunit TctC
MTRAAAPLLAIGMMCVNSGGLCAQDYPNKPIRIVTSAVGSSVDFTARLIAQGISASLGQPVIVDNRASSGIIPGQTVSQAQADGYTLLIEGSTFWFGSLLQKTPYDPVTDFSPITLATRAPNILVVHPGVAAKSVKELVALAKAKPGELNYATSVTGGASHLSAELFKYMTGIDIVQIPYRGAGSAVSNLIAGEVQVMFATAAAVVAHVKSGRLTALAVTSAQPSAILPGVPTVAASGVPGYESVSMNGVFVPAKTPGAIIRRLNQEVVRFLHTAKAKELFFKAGTETVGNTPAEFAAIMKSEMARMGKVIKDARIRLD